MERYVMTAACVAFAAVVSVSCSSQGRALATIERNRMKAGISLPEFHQKELDQINLDQLRKDTLIVENPDGGGMMVMNAVRDESTGDMVASDVIQAAVVTARFRNVAERNGSVDIEFQVTVPHQMIQDNWQLRLNPDLYLQGEMTPLDPVVITGEKYRRGQLRGYERYNRFLEGIISDMDLLVNRDQLEFFIARNLPAIHALKNDTSVVSDEYERSLYGVDEREALTHYTDGILARRNSRRTAARGRMFDRYVKAPIDSAGIRLDTVIALPNGDFVYNYVQRIKTRPKMKKAEVVISGNIMAEGRRIYHIPESDSLTFYISSLSSFVDPAERYLTKVIERKVHADASFHLQFDSGKAVLSETVEDNAIALASIRRILASLIENREYDLDSIVVTATASPEGSYRQNRDLSRRRGDAVVGRLLPFIRRYTDSLNSEKAAVVNLDETYGNEAGTSQEIGFLTRVLPENWPLLSKLVDEDSVLTAREKSDYRKAMEVADEDVRSALLEKKPFYPYMRKVLYPKLRTVDFSFALHRKGMVKDTIRLTVVDSAYMAGIKAIEDREYDTAISLLGPYRDYNCAVAYAAMGYNHSALEILEKCEGTDKVNYMMAVIWSRMGNPEKAVSHYLHACRQNPAFVYRGNLDPEINLLIREYGLNKEE